MYFMNLSHFNTVVYMQDYSINSTYNNNQITISGEIVLYGDYSLPDRSIIYSLVNDGVLEGEGSLLLISENQNLHTYKYETYISVKDLEHAHSVSLRLHLNDKGLKDEEITFSNSEYNIFNKNLNSIDINEKFQVISKNNNNVRIYSSKKKDLETDKSIFSQFQYLNNNGASDFSKNIFNYLSFYTEKETKLILTNESGYSKTFECDKNYCNYILDWKEVYYHNKDPYLDFNLHKKTREAIELDLVFVYKGIKYEDKLKYNVIVKKDFFRAELADISND
jgi:hypothetical protein